MTETLENPDMLQQQESAWQFQPLREQDLPRAHALSVAARWPHRLEDWAFCLALGEGLAVWEQNALVGVAMRWRYAHGMTIGLIIVADTHRGRGMASQMVEKLLADCASEPVLLHATPAGAGVYARQGFVPAGQVLQMQGEPAPVTPVVVAGQIAELADASALREAIALDDGATGMGRAALLQALASAGRMVGLYRDGRLQAYAVVRRFGRGQVIGPVIAPDSDSALALIDTLLAEAGPGLVRIDIPETSGLQTALLARGLQQVDTVAVMAKGVWPIPAGGTSRFALASQALA